MALGILKIIPIYPLFSLLGDYNEVELVMGALLADARV